MSESMYQMAVEAQNYAKASPPAKGDVYGPWGPDPYLARLPGGSVWQIDLGRLTLADFRMMKSDYQLNASLGILQALIAQADWSIYTKGEETDPKAKKISEVIEEGIRRRWIPLVRAMCAAHWSGYAPTIIDYDINPTSKYWEAVRFKDLVPENARVNWKEHTGRDGTKLYDYNGINVSGKTIPAESTLWYPVNMQNGDYYGTKLLAPAFPSWFFSQLIHLYTNRYYERFGEPTAVGYYPEDGEIAQADGTKLSARDAMANVLTNLRNRGVVTIPSVRDPETKDLEWDIKYLESQMRGADFDRYLDRLDEEKSLALFTPVLMFRTGERGSFNLASMHQDVFQYMLNWMVGDMKTYFDEYLIKTLHDVNFGPNAPRSEIRFRTLGRMTDSGGQSVLQALIQNGGAKVTQKGLRDLGDYLGVELEYLTGVGATPQNGGEGDPTQQPGGAQVSPNVSGNLHGGGMNDRVTQILNPPKTDAKRQLLHARKRMEEQLHRAFSKDGHDRDVALAKIKLGYKGAFINDMVHAGADAGAATEFFNSFERSVRDAFTDSDTEPAALSAVADVYADHGLEGE